MTRIGFIGVGTMGSGMAKNLAAGGYEVCAYDRDRRRLDTLANTLVQIAGSMHQAVEGADFIITMLPNSEVVKQVVEGPGGAAREMRPGSILIDMSTSSPRDVRSLAESLAESNIRMIDAPVGRPPSHAEAGTLLIMVGGDSKDVVDAWPLFECMGEMVRHIGPIGSGATLKVINNYMSMVGMLITAEALTLGRKAGIDRDTVVEVLSSTAAGRGQIIVNYPNKVLAGDTTPDFPMELGLKDIRLALDLGNDVHSPLALGSVTREFFNIAIAGGRGQQDCTSMLLALEELAGMEPSLDDP